jgi:hypothetical protein
MQRNNLLCRFGAILLGFFIAGPSPATEKRSPRLDRNDRSFLTKERSIQLVKERDEQLREAKKNFHEAKAKVTYSEDVIEHFEREKNEANTPKRRSRAESIIEQHTLRKGTYENLAKELEPLAYPSRSEGTKDSDSDSVIVTPDR